MLKFFCDDFYNDLPKIYSFLYQHSYWAKVFFTKRFLLIDSSVIIIDFHSLIIVNNIQFSFLTFLLG